MRRLLPILPAALAALLLGPLAGAPCRAAGPADPALLQSARDAMASAVLDQAGIPAAEAFVSGVRFQDPPPAGGRVVRASLDGSLRSGRGLAFALFVKAADGDVREVRATSDVAVQVPVVVAARNVPAGSTLGPDDVQIRRKELSFGGDAAVHDAADAVGKRVRWQLTGGVPLRREYLEDPDALRRGETVLIETDSGSVRITGKGVALQGGRVGETVLVRSALSGKELAGVLAPGRVVRVD